MTDLEFDADDNLVLGTDQDISVISFADEVEQAIKIALRGWKEEYFLDQRFGVDLIEKVLTYPFKKAQAEREIRRVLRSIKEILSIKNITLTPNYDTNSLSCDLTIITIYGDEALITV